MENEHGLTEQQKRGRGRPRGSTKKSATPQTKTAGKGKSNGYREVPPAQSLSNGVSSSDGSDLLEEQLAYAIADEKLSVFSSILRNILRHDRDEIVRVAKELDVAENTIYRWMSGSTEPRQEYLRRLPDVLREHRNNLVGAINQTFPSVLDGHSSSISEVSRDIYYRVASLAAQTEDAGSLLWQVTQTVFDYALPHLDVDHRGIAITYASLMPAHEDGVHSLREMIMRGTPPWPHSFESKAYLGSTTLAGHAATDLHMHIWDSTDTYERVLVEVDDHEVSACAIPVLRGGCIAGVLVISSAQPGFFKDPMTRKAVEEYALLVAMGLRDEDFFPPSTLNLRPMPPLHWQRKELAYHFANRVIAYARKYEISHQNAELRVRSEMEKEFEEVARNRQDILDGVQS
ncbi:MAG: helix-turn-helix transcriptional regulator [Chloroflexi bacterium]|nr:MAG: helix-turn-helix transcriptional regulator [Chloroflexota bacterium]